MAQLELLTTSAIEISVQLGLIQNLCNRNSRGSCSTNAIEINVELGFIHQVQEKPVQCGVQLGSLEYSKGIMMNNGYE